MLSSWNDAVIPALAVGSSVALLWTLLAPDERMRAVRHLPRPQSTLPVIGNTLDLSTYHYDRLHDWIYEQCLIHQGKPWLLQAVGAPPLVIVSSVEAFEDVLKTHFEVFDKGPRMNTIFRDAIGEGIVAVDGEKWRLQRKALTHLFTMRRFRECFTGIIQQHIIDFGEVLQHAATKQDNNRLYPLGEAFQRFAFDTFAHVAFGLEEDALDRLGESQDESKFFKAMTDITKLLEVRFHVPDFVWQFQRALRIGHERELAEALEIVDRKVYDVVHRTLAGATTDTAHQDFLTLMLEHTQEFKDQDNADPKRLARFLRDQGFTMIFGGKDTTGSSLTWFFIMMGRYPHVLAKIREELKSSFPQLFSDRSYLPSMEEIESGLVYLEAALRETLRLYPLAPLNAKEANRDVTLSDGTPIKKGTRVYIPSYALARMPNVWGDDAAEFRPERWLTDANKLRTFSAFQFVSFHAGPRICLGMRFALFQLKSTLAYLLSKFDVELEKPPHEYTYEMAITLSVKGDVKARVTPIKP